jgi:hypothetical protein
MCPVQSTFYHFNNRDESQIDYFVESVGMVEKYIKKNRGHRGPGFFNKKLMLDYYFCLKSGPVFLFQILTIALLPLPRHLVATIFYFSLSHHFLDMIM